MDINVQDIMSGIYNDIDNMNLSVAELYGGNSYYIKCMETVLWLIVWYICLISCSSIGMNLKRKIFHYGK